MADFKIKNIKDAARQIQKELLQDIQKNAYKYENEITEEAQEAVEDLDVVDTRNLKSRTNGKVFTTSTAAVFRFQTVGVPYAHNPYYGLGTSEGYGPRKWLELARARYMKKKKLR